MYVSGFDGRGVKLVWDALSCVFGGGLGPLPVYTTDRLLLWPRRLSGRVTAYSECWHPVMQLPELSTALPLLSGL